MTTTDRFGLELYDQGEDNWDHSDTVNLVDELANESGPYSERPASGTYDGEVYLATDRKIAYQWDATNSVWVAVYGVGTSSNPVPEQHVQTLSTGELFTDPVTVNAADHSSLQAAFDSAPVHGDNSVTLQINLGAGSYGGFSTEDRPNTTILLNGDGTASIDGAPGLAVEDNRIVLDGVTITGTGADPAVEVSGTGAVEARGETFQNTNGGLGLEIVDEGFAFIRDATIESNQLPVKVYSGVANINNSQFTLSGSPSTKTAVEVWDSAQLFSGGNTFTNNTGGGGFAVEVRKGSAVKSGGDTFDSWGGAAFSIREYSGVQVTNSVTLTSTSDLARGFDGAVLRDETTSPARTLRWNAVRAEDPDVSDIRNPTGVYYYADGSGTPAAGLRVYDGGWSAV